MQRTSWRRSQYSTHTVNDALRLLLFLSTLGTATSLVLSTTATSRRVSRTATPTMDFESLYDVWGVSSATLLPPVLRTTTRCRAPETSSAWKGREDIFPVDTHVFEALGERDARATSSVSARTSSRLTSQVMADAATPRRIYSRTELSRALSETDGQPTVLVFGAKTCRTCRRIQPKMEQLTRKAGARFLYVYHDSATDAIFAEHEISQTPTVQVFDRVGALVDRTVYSGADLPYFSRVLDGAFTCA